jgi:deoxycytidine triphosphate deaminase
MKVLRDEDIVRLVEGGLLFRKDTFEKENCEGVFYVLRLGEEAHSVTFGGEREFDNKGELSIEPKECVNVLSVEELHFAGKYTGLIFSRVTFLGQGICHVATTVDPGWDGRLTITLFNVGNRPMFIKRGENACKMMILEIDDAPGRLYSEYGGRVPPAGVFVPSRIRPWSPELNNPPTEDDLKRFADDYGPPYDLVAGSLWNTSREVKELTSRIDAWDDAGPTEVNGRLATLEAWKEGQHRKELILATVFGGVGGVVLSFVFKQLGLA